MNSGDVVRFWFEELTPSQWFIKDDAVDARIRERFLATHRQANRCELFTWRQSAEGRLAEILVLDQFSRNIFRGDAEAFASDQLALSLAQEAVLLGVDRTLPVERRAFVYLPYMHSESQLIHEIAIKLFDQPGLEGNLKFEKLHKAIIDRFGRFPHRNAVLGRASTPEEVEFLKQPGSTF